MFEEILALLGIDDLLTMISATLVSLFVSQKLSYAFIIIAWNIDFKYKK